ncbi:PPE family protein [Mycolicibacter arupensis]|jgi:PPE-repeat protein|uniref:PPE family protein n=1 Tax=Mycolicibacter arupensis TaxID=342002 RepID=A0A5C7Y810_9MYCO|nr:PPE family protein [Mycolicibacter arupensis]TXI57970.1 MAG: PPE family protein [Mycolicibacter arupensis]
MDFGALPPEVNSGRMYTGPGSAPMMAAATAWDAAAAGLEAAAAGCVSVVSGLIGQVWSGPAAAAMVAALTPYVAWLQTTAGQAEQTAAQARAAAAAYEAAFAMTVPPPVIAANRTLLAMLIVTNFFGQNTAAIAATEAQYAEMWAQDAAAMYSYTSNAAAATALTVFSGPPATTNPAGLTAQAGAVMQAAGGAASHTHLLSQLTAVPTALQQLTSTGAATLAPDPPGLLSSTTLFGSTPLFGSTSVLHLLAPLALTQYARLSLIIPSAQVGLGTRIAGIHTRYEREAVQAARFAERQAATGLTAGLGSAGPVSAAAGQAATVGSLSVPLSWAGDPAMIRPAALEVPGTQFAAAEVSAAEMPGSVFSQALMSALSPSVASSAHPRSKPVIVRNPASEHTGDVSRRS